MQKRSNILYIVSVKKEYLSTLYLDSMCHIKLKFNGQFEGKLENPIVKVH